MASILSSNIKVFPSVRRSDTSDLDARLPSEYNLTNIVNRLTNTDSFIIKGLTIEKDSANNAIQLTSGSCNIHGYYFEIKESITLSDIANHDKVYLKIETQTSAINSFVELVGNDESDNTYTGLKITYEEPKNGYYLLLATKNGDNWINNTQASIRYTSEMVEIPTTKKDTQEAYNVWDLFSNPTNQSDLRLNNLIMNLGNLIIDDGDLD